MAFVATILNRPDNLDRMGGYDDAQLDALPGDPDSAVWIWQRAEPAGFVWLNGLSALPAAPVTVAETGTAPSASTGASAGTGTSAGTGAKTGASLRTPILPCSAVHIAAASPAPSPSFRARPAPSAAPLKIEEFGTSCPGGGQGAPFLRAVCDWAAALPGAPGLWLNVVADNAGAIRFYAGAGFAVSGEQPWLWNRRKGPPARVLRMDRPAG